MITQTHKRWPGEVLLLAIALPLVSLYLSHRMLGWIPHIPDEMSYAFQGKILASGRLWLTPPPVPAAFAIDHILFHNGHWCSVYPPGWPLLLAAGWLIHAPWIMNPLLLGVSILGLWRLAIQLFDRETAFLSILLFCISPFVILTSAGFMSHSATLCASLWCLVFLTGVKNSKTAIAAGLLAGYAFLTRPYTAIVLLAPAFFWALGEQKQNRIRFLFLLALGFLPMMICYLVYNHLLFGSFYQAGYAFDPLWEFKGPETQLFFSKLDWFVLNIDRSIWGLPFPDPLMLLPLFLPNGRSRNEILLLVCCLTLLLGYCFYYYTDVVYSGPRFLYEMMGFVSILAARAILRIRTFLKKSARPLKSAFVFGGCALLIFPLGIRLPAQIQYHSEIYHGQSHELIGKVNACGVGKNALVLIAGDYYVFGSFFFQNALVPQDGARVFARDVASSETELRKAYPRKELWRVKIDLQPLPSSNGYNDHWILSGFLCQQLNSNTQN